MRLSKTFQTDLPACEVGAIFSADELKLGNQLLILEPGDSWIVPRRAKHSYRILEPFTAVEATHPPAVVHGRDEKSG